MTNLLLIVLAILVTGVAMAALIVGLGIDPESVEAWRIWSVAVAVASFVSGVLFHREMTATPS